MSAPGPTTLAELLERAGPLFGVGFVDHRTPLTARLLERLPPMYRRGPGAPTLGAYVSAIADLAGAAEFLIDAIDYVGPAEGGPAGDTSILVDPHNTPAPGWLAWLTGVDLRAAGVVGDPGQAPARELIAAGVNGIHAGSRAAIVAAARRYLTGNRLVLVTPGADPDPFTITVSVVAAEVVDADRLDYAIRAVLPAGHGLAINNDVGNWSGIEAAGTWAELMAAAPTWADVERLYA